MRIPPAIQPLVDLVFPPRCPLCGGAIAAQAGVCADCWPELVIPGEPCCSRCQRPFGTQMAGSDGVCAPCLADPPRHDGIIAATLYNDASRKLVLGLKHGHRIALAPVMAHQIAARLLGMDASWLLVPVPLHRGRLWRRGFNQAALIARAIGDERGNRVLVDGLVRHKPTPSLGGLNARARRRALSGTIAINPKQREAVKGANIILVDDVLTSGATTDACIAALKRAGALKVAIACYARVLDEALDLVA